MPIIDEDRLARNIARAQAYFDRHGKAFRPHIKTHKIVALARRQIAAGAVGINCQKIAEAEVFADGGIGDILITYNIMGPEKLGRLRALHERVQTLTMTADNAAVVQGLAASFDAARPLRVLVDATPAPGDAASSPRPMRWPLPRRSMPRRGWPSWG
ncbi:MAG: alanine racemase [Paracoccus sp. (in: a-proteobacteria)]|uniref:alanine racemase n=1 Tax=Paracoccus sp. TaxID=267 RepID=UPI0039E2D62B